MNTASSKGTRRRMLLAAIAIVAAGAGQDRPAPRFEGKSIPDPPAQGTPWTAPASTLPKFLLDATAALFEQGVADPRGCEYRAVEIANGSIIKGRGFVLPGRPDAHGRFVVGWDGLVYPAPSVGEPADLDGDVRAIAENMKKVRESGHPGWFGSGTPWSFSKKAEEMMDPLGVDDDSPVKLGLLLRLGRAALAETLFAAGTTWTPGPRPRDLTDYPMSYLSLASHWAASAHGRLIGAHNRGDDAIALDLARRLVRFRDLATAKADAMGFARADRLNQPGGPVGDGPAPRFGFLGQLDHLLRDQERRAAMPPRGPIPKRGGDPTARVAALIRDLDLIDERPWAGPSRSDPGNSALVKDLIAEGDPAVDPLLAALESDDRLTRTVTWGWGRSFNAAGRAAESFVHPVHEAAFAALVGLLKTREFDQSRLGPWDAPGRRALAASMRQFWERRVLRHD